MSIQFLPNKVAPQQIADAALVYLGIPYSYGTSYFAWDSYGRPYGMTSCYGLPLQVAKDLFLLSYDFDINIPPSKNEGRPLAVTLTQIICTNFVKVERQDMAIGDLIIMQYKDVNPQLNEPHHVALCTDDGDRLEMIHAFARHAGGGEVCKQRIDELIYSRIAQVWRMKNAL